MTVLWLCGSALATPPAPLTQVPEDGSPGSVAGRFNFPLGVTAEQSAPGHVFVLDFNNARIDELSARGEFVKAWGFGVRDGSAEPQTCTEASGCQAGLQGAGTGQFNTAEAIAVDGAGDVYVVEALNHRIQKFHPGDEEEDAEFVAMFGRDVNKTKVEEAAPAAQRNLCTAASGDECQAGITGSGPGELGGGEFSYFSRLAASPAAASVYLAEGERIQRFGAGGAFEEEIEGGCLALKKLQALAADNSGALYAAFEGEAEVRKLEGSGPAAQCTGPSFESESAAERPRALALDGSGHLYVALGKNSGEPERVQEYAGGGECLTCGEGGEEEEYEPEPKVFKVKPFPGFDRVRDNSQLRSVAASSACGPDDVYVAHFTATAPPRSYIRAFGEAPTDPECETGGQPPLITAQYATGVEASTATLRAKINPRFGETTYHLQYGTEACIEGGGWEAACVSSTASRPLEAGAVNEPIVSAPITIEGLTPGTAYRYRFAAESSGAPGEEVFGVGGTPGSPGTDAGFATFRTPGAEPLCPANEAFRAGPSASLPDCRAYEMVSPLDKEGGDIVALLEASGRRPAVLSESAASGGRLAYGSYRTFADPESSPYTTQYVATRVAGAGWASHAISPPRGETIYHGVLKQAESEFKAFSEDLCEGWLRSLAEVPGTVAPEGVSDLFARSDNECGGPAYEALNEATPPVKEGEEFKMELQGLSADGATAAFMANDYLASGAKAGRFQLYAREGGQVRFECVLPGGGHYAKPCVAGGNAKGTVEAASMQVGNVTGALSGDGTRLYWTALKELGSSGDGGGPGQIYLRSDPFGAGAECSGPGAPCTVAVSAAAEAAESHEGSQFQLAASDGSRALFTTNGTLYEYRAAGAETEEVAGEIVGSLLGASRDASRVYFASREALGGPNAEGKEASEGATNLYYREAGGEARFVARLLAEPLDGLAPISYEPQLHTARVSPDGQSATFTSEEPLTGYDNTDRSSGKADGQVFVYRAEGNGGAGELICASCNPSGARPRGAAKIPTFETTLYATRVLAEDGKRLFFESSDALLPADTNGRKDVYQWEAAGAGSCTTASSSYAPANGGCLSLISSGQSELDSEFIDASPSGDDVFFATLSSLVPQDYGLRDIYDARVGGGLPSPAKSAECDGESCQSPAAAPAAVTPASEAFHGPGNAKADNKSGGCAKGKHKAKRHGKTRCVKNKARHRGRHRSHARAHRHGRAGR